MTKLLFVLFTGCLCSADLISQSNGKLFDIFTNESIIAEGKYIDLSGKSDGPDASYPILKGLKDSLVQRKLNKRLYDICVKQLGTDTFRARLFKDVKEVMDTYFEVHKKTKNQLGIYSGYSFSPLIYNVDYKFLSFNYPFLTFLLEVDYKTQYQDVLNEQNFIYYEIYYFDVSTGKEYGCKHLFNPVTTGELSAKIIAATNSNLEKIDFSEMENDDEYEPDEYDESFYEQEIKKGEQKKRVLCKEFSVLTDCLPYVSFTDFAFHIRSYSPCTKSFYGNSVEVHFSLEELKKYINPAGPLAFILKMKKEISGVSNFANPFYSRFDQPFFKVPFLDEFSMPVKNFTGNVTVKRRQLPPNSTAPDTTVKEELMRVMKYKNEKINEIVYFDYGKEASKDIFYYSPEGDLIKKSNYNSEGKLMRTEDYKYDEKNNATAIIKTDADGENEASLYFYGAKSILFQYRSGDFLLDTKPEVNGTKYFLNDSGRVIRSIHLSNSLYSAYAEVFYQYSKKGRLVSSYNSRESAAAGRLFVYSNEGNVLSYEYDNSRYFQEYMYDEGGNLVEQTGYEFKRQNYSKKVQYNEKGFPVRAVIKPGGGTYIQIYRFFYD